MSKASAGKIAKGSILLTLSFLLAKGSQLISQVILARLLSPEDFGIWAMVLVVTVLSSLFKESAIAQVLIQRGIDDKKLVDAVYSLGINISIGVFIAQAFAGFVLAHFFGVPILWSLTACVGLVFLINAGAGSHTAVMTRQMQFKQIAICDTFAGVARFLGAWVAAAYGLGVWAFVAGEIAMALVDSVLKRHLSGYQFTYHLFPDQKAIREVRGYISGLIGINLAVYANTSGDNLVIGKLLGTKPLGYYNMAYQLAMFPVYALSQINRVNFSVMSQQDNEERKTYLCRALELYAVISAPIYGLAFIVAPWAIPVVYGSEWQAAVKIFQIVLVFAYARGFMAILGTALNALGRPGTNAAINWALVPLSISSYLLGSWLGGTTGVAIAVALVMGIGATIWFWLTICRVAGWNIAVLVKPILLPTLTISLTIAAVLALPLSVYFQPIAVILIYGIAISIFSPSRFSQMVLNLYQRFFQPSSKSTDK